MGLGKHMSTSRDGNVPSCYVLTAKPALDNEERGECVSMIAKEFGITDELPVFRGKARQAKNFLFW